MEKSRSQKESKTGPGAGSRQEEMIRAAKAVAQAQQGQRLNWESVEKRKLSWRELWNMEDSCMSLLIGAMYDVLPTPKTLKVWLMGTHHACYREIQR